VARQRQQQVLGRDVLVLQLAGGFVGVVQDAVQLAADRRIAAARLFGQTVQRAAQ
jgi:hypothetical protein